MTTQKLELTWVGKNHKIRLEPRILIEDTDLSYGDPETGNMLIHGDNLLALKALEQDYAGKVKCIYIDPPYNTGNAFEHYDDGLEHSEWLNLMRPRLEILRRLLSNDGIIWVQIDDVEQAYLKVIMDEIFGRKNFIATFIWEGRAGKGGTAGQVSFQHEYIHCYQKSPEGILKKEERVSVGGNYSDHIGGYKREQLRQWGQGDRREDRPTMWYPIIGPDGKEIYPLKDDGTEGRWRVGEKSFYVLLKNELIDFVAIEGQYKVYRKIRDGRKTETAYGTIFSDLGTSATGTGEIKEIFGGKTFATPKPEKLIAQIIELSSKEGDIILDSFLGSGTTCAVAQKMRRKYIGIELGDHAYTHCKIRLDKVIDGKDFSGITGVYDWQGGGGYKFYELGPSVMAKDERGRYVINPNMNGELLVRALCKIENFRYLPKGDGDIIKHGYSTERDFLHVTTRLIDQEAIDRIKSKYLKDDESILILAKTVADGIQLPPNIQVKKIPNEILRKCEYAKDDYSLPILTQTQEELEGLKKDIIQIDNQD